MSVSLISLGEIFQAKMLREGELRLLLLWVRMLLLLAIVIIVVPCLVAAMDTFLLFYVILLLSCSLIVEYLRDPRNEGGLSAHSSSGSTVIVEGKLVTCALMNRGRDDCDDVWRGVTWLFIEAAAEVTRAA